MRLSEKTLELNICAQLYSVVPQSVGLFWFGLTQKQEARAGFDACAKLHGMLVVFQFKASRQVLQNGDRRFLVPHRQMELLRRAGNSRMRSVFYAFPLVGTTQDIAKDKDLLARTWLLDVMDLPLVGLPTKADGTLRRNGCHNVYVRPGLAVVHSDPVEARVIQLGELASGGFAGSEGQAAHLEDRFEEFWELAQHFSRGARGLVIYPH